MKNFLDLLTAIVILAILSHLTMALGIALLILLLLAALTYPRRTLHLVAALGLLAMALTKPAICAAAIGAVGVAAVVTSRMWHQRKRPLTPPALLRSPDATLTSSH